MTSIQLITTEDAAELLCLEPNTLEKWRVQGRGPPYLKVGRLVYYRHSDLHAWLEQQVRQSTSDEIKS